MTAFSPIAPNAAAELVDEAGLGDATRILVDFAIAGLVKGYARWMEKVQPNGRREEVRDKRIPPELWKRIVAEGKVGEVASGTVRLDGSSEFGGGPKVTIVGIRFDDLSLQAVLAQHSGSARSVERASKPPKPVSAPKPDGEAVAPESPVAPAPAGLTAIPEGAVTVTIKQAMAAMGLGRTTIDKLCREGKLVRVRVGGRALITVDSIRALIR